MANETNVKKGFMSVGETPEMREAQQKIIRKIKKMDVSTESFFEVYKAVTEKYWTFDDPDDEQSARKTLYLIAERGDAEHVVVLTMLFKELLDMTTNNRETTSAEIGFKDQSYFFTISDKPQGVDKLKQHLLNTVVVKSREAEQ